MNQKLLDNNYIIIPNFISNYRANKLKDEFIEFSQQNNLGGDSQIPTSSSDYNYISFLELLCEKTPEVSEILEETVLPTYTYARVYKNGSVLEKHSDRDSCEISLTLHLGGDQDWPIFIKSPEGEDQSVVLAPGDAMMYRGTIAEHWRDEYVGEEYVQVFLHYVRSRGDCAYTYFDTENHKGKHSNHNKKITIDKTLEVEVKEDTIKRSPILIKPASKLEDFVQVFDNVLSPENCNLILDEYKNTSEWDDTRTGDGQISKNIRNCMEIGLSLNQVLEQNFDVRKNLDNIVFESVKKVIDNYNALVPTFRVDIDTGYNLLRYREGEFYTQHTDSFKEQQRSLSCSIQLNEDYEGGEFALFDREMMIRTSPGSAIVFPSNFMYPHEIMPVIKGTRYSIITWLV
jgi:predicted 2-oxoglutarate/Fe(II)-dependent dioxygenase YbiX